MAIGGCRRWPSVAVGGRRRWPSVAAVDGRRWPSAAIIGLKAGSHRKDYERIKLKTG